MTIEMFASLFFSGKMEENYQRGYLLDYDLVYRNTEITRKHAARIIHSYLKKIRLEEELKDWSAAEELKDLYQCKTCAIHIAQVYAKGIIREKRQQFFDADDVMTEAEINEATERVFHPEKRLVPPKKDYPIINECSLLEAEEYIRKGAVLIDVREREERTAPVLLKHRCIPLSKLELNPYQLPRDVTLLFACNYGYKSTRAIRIATEYGYGSKGLFKICLSIPS